MSERKPRIILLSISDRPVLSDTTFNALRSYCDRYSYDIDIRTTTLDPNRHISWSKLVLFNHWMKKAEHDYYVWIDDDILITNHDITIESFIKKFEFDTSPETVLISEDVVPSCPFNCGLMICKRESLTLWVQVWQLVSVLQNHFQPNWEQDALIFYHKNIRQGELKVIPHKVIQSFYRNYALPSNLKWTRGDFAAHITGMPLQDRLRLLKEVMSAM